MDTTNRPPGSVTVPAAPAASAPPAAPAAPTPPAAAPPGMPHPASAVPGAAPRPANPAGVGSPSPAPAAPNKIQHTKPAIGRPGPIGPGAAEPAKAAPHLMGDVRPLPVADNAGLLAGAAKITAFGKDRRHEDIWKRTPNTTGSGAIHVKTFHCKLTEDALVYMDQAINEWLDAHPQYEVKFVSSTVGTLTGKLKEPALFCQIWV